jgi:hypothetical protein
MLILAGCDASIGGGSGKVVNGSNGGPPIRLETSQAANVVIGQVFFEESQPNQREVVPFSNTLSNPVGRPAVASIFYVPDAGNNRILGFDTIPGGNGADAIFVMGQLDFFSFDPGTFDPFTITQKFRNPTDTWIAGNRLFLADSGNHRVLIWNALPVDDVPADVVVGQIDFNSMDSGTPESNTLNNPTAVAVAGDRLFVVDHDNNRVLIYNRIPDINQPGASIDASIVVGQPNFTSNNSATTQAGLNSPSSVWIDGQRLVVADSSNNRVLIWDTIPMTDGEPANIVVGQVDFTSGAPGTGADGLSNPMSVFSNGRQLFIADTGNNRVLIFNTFPTANQPSSADVVLGQENFSDRAPNRGNQEPSAQTFNSPTGVFANGRQLFVTDRGNNRILIFNGR